MFGIGGWEFFIVAVLALLLFGPDKLPEFARTIGRFTRDFKRYKDLMESTLRAEIYTSDTAKPDAFKTGKEFREKVESGEIGRSGQGRESETSSAEEAAESASDGPVRSRDEVAEAAEEASGEAAPVETAPADGASRGREGVLPADHPLSAAYAAGEDVGLDDDLDLSTIDPADIGWVPGRGGPAKEVDEGEA